MVKSMTSFGRGQMENNQYSLTIEMKSVNSRYLDLNIRMPKFMLALENKIRKLISSQINRGKVDVFLTYNEFDSDKMSPKLNMKLAKSYYDCSQKIANELNVEDDITTFKIMNMPEVISLESKDQDLDEIMKKIKNIMHEALDAMSTMREYKGEKLKIDLDLKLSQIKDLVLNIEEISISLPGEYKKKLEERIEELTADIDINEERIASEVAMFADKSAIDEEITRLNSHISQMKDTLNLNEPIGRKLDFIIQEMNREINTIGSKANNIKITNMVINIKNIIEKDRKSTRLNSSH